MKYAIELERDPSDEKEGILLQGVNEADYKIKKVNPIEYYALFIKDLQGEICGGISIILYYGCVSIDLLWVSPELRDQGWGSKLIEEALLFAKKKECLFATAHTMDWQAVSFYQKLGFHIEFISKGYQYNSELYVLRRNF